MRTFSRHVSLSFSLGLALLSIGPSALAATASKVIAVPPAPATAAEFVKGVAALEANPLDAKTQHTTPALIIWLNQNHPISNSAKMCAAQMPLISEAQVGDDVAAVLYVQNELELGAYQLQHPQASDVEAQSAALTSTLRMYLTMRKQGMKAVNAFSETILADVKARGLAAVATHTCAGSIAPAVGAL